MSKGRMINIGGDENDANYRYKMPPLYTKVEGRGNGIKTILMNVTDVCKHLHTEPQYATRFFGIECGAVSKWDDKRETGIVHGVHDKEDLQKSLKKFVREFILCPKCRLPELQMKVAKKGELLIRCASCGHKGRNVSTHKVKQYIINHPPKSKSKRTKPKPDDTDKRKGKGRQKGAKSKKETIEEKVSEFDANALGGENDEVWSVNIDDTAVAKRKQYEMETLAKYKSQLKNDTKENEIKEENDDNDDNDDELNNIQKYKNPYGTYPNDKKNEESGPSQVLRSFINDRNRTTYEILDEIKRLGMAHNLDEPKKFKVALEAICNFDTPKKFINTMKKNTELLKLLNRTDEYSMIFFGCLEEIIAKRNPDLLLPRTYMILEAIYDSEIATEEQILGWYKIETDKALLVEHSEAQQVRTKAAPFIKWLEEADEDDDDDTSGESEEDVD